MLYCSSSIRRCRIFGRLVEAKVLRFSVDPNGGKPSIARFKPMNALEAAFVSALAPLIVGVLRIRACPQIISLTIQAITVYVVAQPAVKLPWQTENLPVHENGLVFFLVRVPLCSSNVRRPRASGRLQVPSISGEPCKICVVHKRMGHNVAGCIQNRHFPHAIIPSATGSGAVISRVNRPPIRL